MTTFERTEKLAPIAKIDVLVNELDILRQRVSELTEDRSLDELTDVCDIAELSAQFGVSPDTMRKKLARSGGKVFKLGKKHVIRKITLLEVLEYLERGDC